MRKAVLIRVGIDSTSGGWVAPVNSATMEFAYVPIPENEGKVIPKFQISYEGFNKPCAKLSCPIPSTVTRKFNSIHLDPDFSCLTYGDIDEPNGRRHRGKPLLDLQEDDLLVFYASLDPGRWRDPNLELMYAIIGLYVIKESPRRATDMPDINKDRDKNAHTRRDFTKADIIVCAKPAPLSGRLERCIPIGKRRRNGHYYLEQSLFDKWGGFARKSGLWLQRSAVLPSFNNAEKFYQWFRKELDKRHISLKARNNLD